jgi:hypothetical protein
MKGSVVKLLWTFLRKLIKVTGLLTFLDSGGFILLVAGDFLMAQ